MYKIFFSIIISLTTLSFYGQNNDYFGSIVIPKNEYMIKTVNSDNYWGLNSKNEVVLTKGSDYKTKKIMFIPASNGFYHIKFLHNGYYLTTSTKKGECLKATEPERNNEQKFKVIKVEGSKFKFSAANNLVIEYTLQPKEYKPGTVTANSLNSKQLIKKLKVSDFKGSNSQIFEILEVQSKKKLVIE